MSGYSPKLLEHFRHPRNQGKIKNPDVVATVGNPMCGDIMRMYLKFGKNKKGEEIITDIKFETLGCAAAIGVSSLLSTMVKGKTLKAAYRISSQDIAKEAGGLPQHKYHCSVLADRALKKAIEEYWKKSEKSQ